MARKTSRKPAPDVAVQDGLPLAPATEEHLDIAALEQWLWDAACTIRGAADAPKLKGYLLPQDFFRSRTTSSGTA